MKDTRDHILQAAFGLFLQKSFKEVTMKEIVEKTGLSKGAFYHYFDSKEQVYLEIINQAFSSLIYVDYGRFSKTSLHDFYYGYVDYLKRVYDSFQSSCNGDSFDLNYYSLIFDALRLFPDFKEKMLESSGQEMDSWEAVVRAARGSGEIRSSMSDGEIAGIFVHTGSGIGMSHMMLGESETSADSLLELWNSFYRQIKA
jgi:TetR/AcrR family transcriptional regulator, transcriptional repressor for nem operon